jgi:hypothetical protein
MLYNKETKGAYRTLAGKLLGRLESQQPAKQVACGNAGLYRN